MADAIRARMKEGVQMEYADTICRQVSNRVTHLRNFATAHDVILFVTGAKAATARCCLTSAGVLIHTLIQYLIRPMSLPCPSQTPAQ